MAELEHGPQAKPQIGRFEAQFMELFTSLIRMCHPDRNGGDPAAHKVTVWLLDTREQIKKLSANSNG